MNDTTMEIRVNGEKRALPGGATVRDLIELLGFGQKRVAVERNMAVVPRADYDQTRLAAGDVLEIVSFVGGG